MALLNSASDTTCSPNRLSVVLNSDAGTSSVPLPTTWSWAPGYNVRVVKAWIGSMCNIIGGSGSAGDISTSVFSFNATGRGLNTVLCYLSLPNMITATSGASTAAPVVVVNNDVFPASVKFSLSTENYLRTTVTGMITTWLTMEYEYLTPAEYVMPPAVAYI